MDETFFQPFFSNSFWDNLYQNVYLKEQHLMYVHSKRTKYVEWFALSPDMMSINYTTITFLLYSPIAITKTNITFMKY